VLSFFAARSSSLRATLLGASKIRRGSFTVDVRLANVFRLTQCWVSPSSMLSCDRQFYVVDLHPRWPPGVIMLLTYTHNSFSVSVVVVPCICMVAVVPVYYRVLLVLNCICGVGCIRCVYCVRVFCVFVFCVVGVYSFCFCMVCFLVFAVSLAIMRSTCLRIISYSFSISSSSSSSVWASGAITIISFPFLDFFCAATGFIFVCSVLGPGGLIWFVLFVGWGVVSVRFLYADISTYMSIMA
jgi:hypothetical protein